MMRSVVVALILVLAMLPGLSAWAADSAVARVEKARLLLYQTYNFPIAERIGTPGFPNAVVGTVRVTTDDGGRYGEALHLPDGPSCVDYAAEANFPLSRGYDEGTIAFWVCCDVMAQPATGAAVLLEVGDATGPGRVLQIALSARPEASLRFDLYPSRPRPGLLPDPEGVAAKPVDWARGAWHHIAATWSNVSTGRNDAHMALYLEGRKAAEHGRFEHIVLWKDKGRRIRLGEGFTGKIDDLAVFGRELSSREIQKICRHPEGVSGVYLSTAPRRRVSPMTE